MRSCTVGRCRGRREERGTAQRRARRLRASGWLCLVALCCCLQAAPARGQDTTTAQKPAAPPADEPTNLDALRTAVEGLKQQIADSTELEEAGKAKAQELVNQALDNITRAGNLREEASRHTNLAGETGARLEATRAALDALQKQPAYTPPENADLAQIEQELGQKSTELASAKKELSELDAEQSRRSTRRKTITDTLATTADRLAEVKKQLETPPPADEPALLSAARQRELSSRQAAIEAERAAFNAELIRYDAERQVSMVPTQLDLATRRVARLESAVSALQALKTRVTARQAEERAREARLAALEADPELKEYAERNRQLAEQAAEVLKAQQSVAAELKRSTAALEEIRKKFERTKEKVDTVGLTRPIGLLLRRQRAQLSEDPTAEPALDEFQHKIDLIHLELFEISEERADLPKPEDVVDSVLAEAGARYDEDDRALIEEQAEVLLDKQRELLDILYRDYSAYFETLVEWSTQETLLASVTEEYARYIDERVLWIRTSRLLTWEVVSEESHLVAWLAAPRNWRDVWEALAGDAREQPAILLSALLFFAALFYFGRRFRQELDELGAQARRPGCVRFSPTLRAALLTLLISLLWPGILLYLGWRLSLVENPSDFVRGFSGALFRAARIYILFDLFRHICRGNGLAEAHFGWSEDGCRLLRRRLRLMMVGIIPVVFVMFLLRSRPDELARDALERVCFVFSLIVLGGNLRRILHPRTGVTVEMAARQPGGWTNRFRHVWPFVGWSVPAVLSVLAIVGYYYAAQQMSVRLIASVWLVVGLFLLRGFVVRWLLVYRRRLRTQQLRERRAALQEGDGGSDPVTSGLVPAVEEREVDLDATSTQTRKLLHAGLVLLGLAGAWAIWLDVTPALGVLDRWPLWHTTIRTTEAVSDDVSGSAEATKFRITEKLEAITVIDVIWAVMIGIFAIVAARNVPGLLEMTVLGQLPMDAALRYAITQLVSYGLTIVGVLIFFSTLGIGWDRVQWLAAALTVGLGFGLQEVFANFVCGLIILFERPVRVGDIVTIGDVTGVITRIRSRATTITNFERKELIVPNKEFITGRLLNWTLTDSVNRMELAVGVAYGSDTVLAHQLLLKIANGHPLILNDPEPLCTFSQFGSHSLTFILRVYLPNMDNRLDVTHDLHTQIDREFRKAGIEIALPQRDLHLRSVPQGFESLLSADGNGESPRPAGAQKGNTRGEE